MLGLGRPEKLNPYRALVMLLKLQPFPEGLGLLLVHSKCGCCCCFITSSMAIPPLDYCLLSLPTRPRFVPVSPTIANFRGEHMPRVKLPEALSTRG